MSLTFGFYNSINGDRVYDAIQMGQIFDGIITDGIYATYLKAMVVKASDNPSEVIVQPGRCWFNHTWTYIDADHPVEAPAPEVILDRVDALVIDINSENAFRENSLIWVQGTPSSLNPERPALIKSVTHNQYPLCYVYRKAGTTMIYAADITNAVGTSETPFVTGVLQGINIDDLLAQWDDEFHTWEAATKTSFEAWMVNQQSVYVTWFNSIKDQMEGDLTSFEAWFETIRGIIDEEAATHLQAEIDELKDMLPAGSHIDISTSEPTLFNRNVTVSDGVHSKTVQLDASGATTVESFPYIGIISVTSTDGTRTAEESINIPYFGRYSVTLAFWSATVNLVGDDTLAALPVTVRDSNGDVIAVVTLNASGQGVFTATKPDTYKFIYTYGGQTMEVSLAVTQETTYEVEIHGGFRFDQWLIAGRVEEEFDTLDEILADEPTLRQLMLVHDSVDYICDTFSESATSALTDITKIFNTDLAAKWINLSDYALDHFYAVSGIKSIMDTADKYGYGEWTLMPQVPTMIGNTAPFGEASINGTPDTDGQAYRAFDNNESTTASLATASTTGYVQYKFVNLISIKQFMFLTKSLSTDVSLQVSYSDDGSTFTDISESFTYSTSDSDKRVIYTFSNDYGAHLYWRITRTRSTTAKVIANLVQFYAWAPKGNVPVMTSATAPYGTVNRSSEISSYEAYKAFDGDDTTSFKSNNQTINDYIGYVFVNPVKAKKAVIDVTSNLQRSTTTSFKIQATNDGSSWVDVSEEVSVTISYEDVHNRIEVALTSNEYYLQYRAYRTARGDSSLRFSVFTLQFYGRELKVSVPKMTSNTAPYGEITSSFPNAYKFFNKNETDSQLANSKNEGEFIGYKFVDEIIAKYMWIKLNSLNSGSRWPSYIELQKWDGANWLTIERKTPSYNEGQILKWDLDDVQCKGLRYLFGSAPNPLEVYEIYFFGEDYSEKEFEVGTTKKWLYDHGVELEEMTIFSTGRVTKNADSITLDATSTLKSSGVYKLMDITSYSMAYSIMESIADYYAQEDPSSIVLRIRSADGASTIATTSKARLQPPTKFGLSISSINGNYQVTSFAYSQKAYLKELWLE